MKIDTTRLLCIFDELLPLTNEEEGTYWFKAFRKDGLVTTLAVSVYEAKVAISVYSNSKTAIVSLHFINCSEINVLDEKRKCLEVLHDNTTGRCFLSLSGESVLEYSE